MNTRQHRSRWLTLAVPMGAALAFAGCTAASPPDEVEVEREAPEAQAPDSAPVGVGRFFASSGGDAAEEGAQDIEESCAQTEAGGWECTYADATSACTYGFDADGVLTHQECSGEWGEYDCLNTGAELVCTWTSERGSCTDRYSLEYELIASDCAPDMYYPAEDCTTQDDGTTLCRWEDGETRCDIVYGADGAFLSQACGDGSYAYNCQATAEQIDCQLLIEGEQVCTDTYDAQGNPLETGCDAYFGSGEPGAEECTEQADGSFSCVYDDGYWSCTSSYQADGALLSSDCATSDGLVTYSCAPERDGLIHCQVGMEGERCEEVYGADGELVSSTCA